MKNDPLDVEGMNRWWQAENAKQEAHFQRLFYLIGKATSAFAHLEGQLNQCFAEVINHRNLEVGLCVADKLSYKQTCDAFEAVCREITKEMRPAIQQQLADLRKKLDEAAKLRNDAAHSSFDYVIGSDGQFVPIPSRAPAKKKVRKPLMRDPFPALERAFTTICETEQELIDFAQENLD